VADALGFRADAINQAPASLICLVELFEGVPLCKTFLYVIQASLLERYEHQGFMGFASLHLPASGHRLSVAHDPS
jgi:hypothetical protein